MGLEKVDYIATLCIGNKWVKATRHLSEAVSRRSSVKFHKIHRKTPVPDLF